MGSIFRMCESVFVHAAPDLITLACFFFETVAIDDVDLAAPIADQALRLKLTGYQCHRASLHAEHFGKEFVCQRQQRPKMADHAFCFLCQSPAGPEVGKRGKD